MISFGDPSFEFYYGPRLARQYFVYDRRLFPLKTKKYLQRHPVVGIYLFYENWSTETFRKFEAGRLVHLRIVEITEAEG